MTPSAPVITTARLYLRAARESDLEVFHGMFSDPEVMKYWSTPPHTALLQTQTYLSSMLASSTNGTLDFVICLPLNPAPSSSAASLTIPKQPHPARLAQEEETVIGKLGIWSPTSSEIGLMLHRSHWRKGYMREALSAYLKYVWESKDGRSVEKVTADVDPRNEACVGLLKNAGFGETGRKERTWRVGGVWCDSVYLEMRRPEGGGEGEGKRAEEASEGQNR